MVVSAPGADSDRAGVGSAYVYGLDQDTSTWIEQARLEAPDATPEDRFGQSVAVYADTIAVGGAFDTLKTDDDPAAGTTNHAQDKGPRLAYVFRRDDRGTPEDTGDDAWIEQARLRVTDSRVAQTYGTRVALSRTRLLVGALGDLVTAPGCAYVFSLEPDSGEWTEPARLVAQDGDPLHEFGSAVALDGDVVVVGARSHDGLGFRAGAVYVFRYDGSDWVEEARLFAPDGGADYEAFGLSVAIENDTILVGAQGDSEKGDFSGAVYAYKFDGRAWVPVAKLLASDGKAKELFGQGLALSGDTALIGAFHENGVDFGSAYLLRGFGDCNGNGVPDTCDVSRGTSPDRNHNGLADECEPFPALLSENTTGHEDANYTGPPDDVWASIGENMVEYDFGNTRVVDGEGPDLNVYEIASGRPDFATIDVMVSVDGAAFVSISDTVGAGAGVPGDGAREHIYNEGPFTQAYDLAGSGLEYVRFVRIQGLPDPHGGDGIGFELDAVGAIHFGPAEGDSP